jgi:hypothetical protein
MNPEQTFMFVLTAVVVFLPVILALPRGADLWEFLTFIFCAGALLLFTHEQLGFELSEISGYVTASGAISWLLAWLFAAIARSNIRRAAAEAATLRAIEEQTQILREYLKEKSGQLGKDGAVRRGEKEPPLPDPVSPPQGTP